MSRSAVFACLVVATLALAVRAGEDPPAPETVVEHMDPLPSSRILGTAMYRPTETEKEFLEATPEDAANRGRAGFATSGPTITGHAGEKVAWFGIVRRLVTDHPAGVTRLLVEMKYFDGLHDIDLMIVSIHGGGTFVAVVAGTDAGVGLHDLVRVYGTVDAGEDDVPEVRAAYVRHWRRGLYTFMAYGEDQGDPAWRKLRKVSDEDVYGRRLTREFYEARLGPRPEPTLCDRLGGTSGLRALARAVLGDLTTSAVAKELPALAGALDPATREEAATSLAAFLESRTGGEAEFEGPGTKELLGWLDPTEEQFRALLDRLRATMERLRYPEEVREALAARLEEIRQAAGKSE